jgi:hypothetical protein
MSRGARGVSQSNINVILPPNQAYATDRASQTLLSPNFDKIPALFDLPQFEDELPSFLHPAKAHDLGLLEGFDDEVWQNTPLLCALWILELTETGRRS